MDGPTSSLNTFLQSLGKETNRRAVAFRYAWRATSTRPEGLRERRLIFLFDFSAIL